MRNDPTPPSLTSTLVKVKRHRAFFVSIDSNTVKEPAFLSGRQGVQGIESPESDIYSQTPGMLAVGIASGPSPIVRQDIRLQLHNVNKAI